MGSDFLASNPIAQAILAGALIVVALALPFVVGFLAGLAFTWFITRRGWRNHIIPRWVIPVMFGTLAYAVTPAILWIVVLGPRPRAILAGLASSLLLMWPIWLVMGPVLYLYLGYLKKREKWLRDPTVVYLSGFALVSEGVFISWLWH